MKKYIHWFSITATSDYKAAANMLKEYLAEHKEASVDGMFYNPYAGLIWYVKLSCEQNENDLDISYDTGYSPLRRLSRKPTALERARNNMTAYRWIDEHAA